MEVEKKSNHLLTSHCVGKWLDLFNHPFPSCLPSTHRSVLGAHFSCSGFDWTKKSHQHFTQHHQFLPDIYVQKHSTVIMLCVLFLRFMDFFPQKKKSFSDNKIIWKSDRRYCTLWFEIKVLPVNTFRFLSLAIMQKKTAHQWDGPQTTLWGIPDPRFYEKFLLRQWMDLLDSTSWWLHTNLYKRLLRIYSITKTLAFRTGLPKTHTYLAELRLSGHYPAG